MWVQIAAGAFLVGQYIYHRWIEKPDHVDRKPHEFQIPRTEHGAPVSIIYGRVRQNEPILSWGARAGGTVDANGDSESLVDMLFTLGIPVDDGDGSSYVHAWYLGDQRFPEDGTSLTYAGTPPLSGAYFTTNIEQLKGGSTQVLANDGEDYTNAATWAGRSMLTWGNTVDQVPGFRGYVSAFIFNIFGGGGLNITRNPEKIGFEVSSYPITAYPGPFTQIGQDMNPVDALYDILKAYFGKLGLPSSLIDFDSFQNAANTMQSESHGYSRIVNSAEAEQHISEILEQIDGALRENPSTGKLELKLIRNDYDPATIPEITKYNCEDIKDLAVGGWQNIPNKIRVVYTNREDDYRDSSVVAHNQANAVGEDGVVREVVLRMPGVMHAVLAYNIASRELAARSRPIIRCRAIVDRSFIRVLQGDAVKVTWSDPDLAGLIFRVANVDRGTLADGKIALDLIQDYYYVHRGRIPEPPAPIFPIGPGDGLIVTIGPG